MKNIILLFTIIFSLSSCKKDDPSFIFEVDNVNVTLSSADKNRLKTDIEFVSIAYTDLFGSNISQNELENIITTYKSFGDKSLVIEMIIKKFILNGGTNTPTLEHNNTASIEAFVDECYKNLYNRAPNAFEKWYLTDFIENNSDVSAEMVYFSMMTANEYRYY